MKKFLILGLSCLIILKVNLDVANAQTPPAGTKRSSLVATPPRQDTPCGWQPNVDAAFPAGSEANGICEMMPESWSFPTHTITTDDLYNLLRKTLPNGVVTISDKIIKSGKTVFQDQVFPVNLVIKDSALETGLNFGGTHLASLEISNTVITTFNAENITLDQFINLQNLYVVSMIDLTGLKASSYATFSNIECDGNDCDILGRDLELGGNLYLYGELGTFDTPSPSGTPGKIDFSNSTFKRDLYVSGFKSRDALDCTSCAIAGNLTFAGVPKDDPMYFPLQQSLSCRSPQWKEFDMPRNDSIFCNHVDFSRSHVGGDIIIQNTSFNNFLDLDESSTQNIDVMTGTRIHQLLMRQATIGGSLITDPNDNIKLQEVQLIGTSLGKQLNLAGLRLASWVQSVPGPNALADAPLLDLTDVTAASFTECLSSFPSNLVLDGFKYDDFDRADSETDPGDYKSCVGPSGKDGTPGGNADMDNPTLGPDGWLKWLASGDFLMTKYDRPFDPQPYLYLATVLGNKGFNSYESVILRHARWKEMVYELTHWDPSGFGLLLLGILTAYGIGGYFLLFALFWVLISLVISIGVLKRGSDTKELPVIWCLGASIDHLLPVGNLSSEFRDFFDGKDDREYCGIKAKLGNGQKVFFGAYAIWGWILGLLLIAAFTGFTQGR